MRKVDLEDSLSFGVCVNRLVLRSPLIIGVFAMVAVGVLCVARVNGGVASGDGGTAVSFGSGCGTRKVDMPPVVEGLCVFLFAC